MKRCSKCGIEKDESEFAKDNRTKDKLQAYCKLCRIEYNYDYRYNLRQRCFTFFGSKCQRCGEENTDVLTINHIQSPKSDVYKNLKRSGWKLYKQILDNPSLTKYFTLLCMTCNQLDYYKKSGYYSKHTKYITLWYRQKKEKICGLWNNKCFRCFRTFPIELLTINHVKGRIGSETKRGDNMFVSVSTNELIDQIDSGDLELTCFNCNCNRTESSKWIKQAKARKKDLNNPKEPI